LLFLLIILAVGFDYFDQFKDIFLRCVPAALVPGGKYKTAVFTGVINRFFACRFYIGCSSFKAEFPGG
jgi:hypothetical protein